MIMQRFDKHLFEYDPFSSLLLVHKSFFLVVSTETDFSHFSTPRGID